MERAVRALVRAGRIEHRGSRQTGGSVAHSPAPCHPATRNPFQPEPSR